MSLRVTTIEDLVSHYEGVLEQSEDARKVLRSWGLSAPAELKVVKWMKGQLLELLAEGVEKI